MKADYSPHKTISISSVEEFRKVDEYRKLVLKAYTGLGYKVEFTEMPSEREIIEVNKGTIDALVIRFSVIEKSNPDLIRVPVILATAGLFLYCDIELPCDQSVVDEPSHLIGALISQNFSTAYLEDSKASVYKVGTSHQLARMLSIKRLNYILAFEVDGLGTHFELDKSKYKVFKVDSLVAFHYIHRRIKNILPKLTPSLKNIVKSCRKNHQCTF